jgi:hypothetical protein
MIVESEWLGRLLTSDVHGKCMSQEEQTAPSSTSEMCKDEVIRESLKPVGPGSHTTAHRHHLSTSRSSYQLYTVECLASIPTIHYRLLVTTLNSIFCEMPNLLDRLICICADRGGTFCDVQAYVSRLTPS